MVLFIPRRILLYSQFKEIWQVRNEEKDLNLELIYIKITVFSWPWKDSLKKRASLYLHQHRGVLQCNADVIQALLSHLLTKPKENMKTLDETEVRYNMLLHIIHNIKECCSMALRSS